MKLKRIGYYKEMPHGDDTDPSIMDFIHKKIEHKNDICKYLQSGCTLPDARRRKNPFGGLYFIFYIIMRDYFTRFANIQQTAPMAMQTANTYTPTSYPKC